jgi:DNA repair photolyase
MTAASPGEPETLPQPGARKGRGTVWRIAHRFETAQRTVEDDGWGLLDQQVQEELADGTPAGGCEPTRVSDEHCRSILTRNDSPDLPFELSINPYRGCEHGCIYCYARPTHSYLGLSPGLDFETRLVAKTNAAERLRVELARPGYVPRPINIGSATDAYQPVERRLGITRALLQVLDEARHPLSIVTKSGGIVRDLDLLTRLAERRQLLVFISITTLDNELGRRLEPRASAPARRLAAVRALAEAGVWVGVNVAPIIPFVNEPEIERILEAAAAAGARSAHWTVLRLPWEVAPLFRQWLQAHLPDRAERVMARVREMRGGRDYDADFATRMKGDGVWAQLIRQRVETAAARHGLLRHTPEMDCRAFVRPAPPAAGVVSPDSAQASLF